MRWFSPAIMAPLALLPLATASAQTPNQLPADPSCPNDYMYGVYPSQTHVDVYMQRNTFSSDQRTAIREGIESWDYPSHSMDVRFLGYRAHSTGADGAVDIAMLSPSEPFFATCGASSAACTVEVAHPSGCGFWIADIALKSGQPWWDDDRHRNMPQGQYDMAQVVAHEMGHALGFEHNLDPGSIMREELPVIANGNLRDGRGSIGGPDLVYLAARQADFGITATAPPLNIALARFTANTSSNANHRPVWVTPLSGEILGSPSPVWGGDPGEILTGSDRPLGITGQIYGLNGDTASVTIEWFVDLVAANCGLDPDQIVGSRTMTFTAGTSAEVDLYPTTWEIPDDVLGSQSYYLCAIATSTGESATQVDNRVTSVQTLSITPTP